jgi:hypothetical protein
LVSHILHCPYRLEKCMSCDMMVEHHIMKIHQRVECRNRVIECELCGVGTIQSILDEHKRSRCIRRLIPCTYCRDLQQFIAMDRHESMCMQRPVTCPHCRELVRFDKLTDHKVECMKKIIEQQMLLIKLDDVFKEDCPYCKNDFYHDELKYHIVTCAKKKIPCTRCSKMIEQGLMYEHKKNCTYGTIMCHFCCKRFPRHDITNHMIGCLKNPDTGYLSPRVFQAKIRVRLV